jgi:hypothetical protein
MKISFKTEGKRAFLTKTKGKKIDSTRSLFKAMQEDSLHQRSIISGGRT